MPAARPTAARRLEVQVAPNVDTSAADARTIIRLWRTYLADPERQRRPADYWAHDDVTRLRPVDVAGSFTYDASNARAFVDRPAVVLGLVRTTPPESDGYVIRTKLGNYAALLEVFVIRENGRWVLTNALSQRTRGWRLARIGAISYLVHPERRFDSVRASRAAKFVDSLADAFGEPRPARVAYVLAENPGQVGRVIGAAGAAVPDAFARTTSDLVVTGLDEFHAHELAHVVLKRWTGPTHAALLAEGVATWASAAYESGFAGATRALADSLRVDSTLTLARAGAPGPWRERTIGYGAGAVLCQLAYERGGTPAVRRLLDAGPGYEAVAAAAGHALGVPARRVPELWRRRALEYGPNPDSLGAR